MSAQCDTLCVSHESARTSPVRAFRVSGDRHRRPNQRDGNAPVRDNQVWPHRDRVHATITCDRMMAGSSDSGWGRSGWRNRSNGARSRHLPTHDFPGPPTRTNAAPAAHGHPQPRPLHSVLPCSHVRAAAPRTHRHGAEHGEPFWPSSPSNPLVTRGPRGPDGRQLSGGVNAACVQLRRTPTLGCQIPRPRRTCVPANSFSGRRR